MVINGLEKLSLVDFNEKTACTVFLAGCNFRCPFCHNAPLVLGTGDRVIDEEEFFTYLMRRQGLIDGVCITGGEPLLRPLDEMREFIARIRELGYLVKLDTNGTRPDSLIALTSEGLLDYVAMDIKNSPEKYAMTAGLDSLGLDAIRRSIDHLIGGSCDYEFRTTVAHPLHEESDFAEIGRMVSGAKRFFIQKFNGRQGTLADGLSEIPEEKALSFADILSPYVESVTLRGY